MSTSAAVRFAAFALRSATVVSLLLVPLLAPAPAGAARLEIVEKTVRSIEDGREVDRPAELGRGPAGAGIATKVNEVVDISIEHVIDQAPIDDPAESVQESELTLVILLEPEEGEEEGQCVRVSYAWAAAADVTTTGPAVAANSIGRPPAETSAAPGSVTAGTGGAVQIAHDPLGTPEVAVSFGPFDTEGGDPALDEAAAGQFIAVIGDFLGFGVAMASAARAEPGGTVDLEASLDLDLSAGDVVPCDAQDFGDAPDPAYPTLLASDGARHGLGSAVYLGACVDGEADGQPGAGAAGDDGAGGSVELGPCATTGADEDGVVFLDPVEAGTTPEVEVTASQPCTLSGWIDFDGDGDWSDAGEELFPGGVTLPAGTSVQSFAVPAGAAPGTTVARFRCTTDGAVPPTGEANDGEVEDHAVVVTAPPALAATKTAEVPGGGALRLGGTLLYTVVLTNSGGEAQDVVFTDTVDPGTTVVPGSASTTHGTVSVETDTTVEVDVGTVGHGETVVITFDVQVSDVPPEGPHQVTNQGLVTAADGIELVTDDPDTLAGADPTVTALLVSPLEIPTLGEAGLLALGLLLAGLAWRRLGG